MKEIIGIIGGVLFLLGYIPYGIAIINNNSKPQKTTWIIWISLDSITFLGMLAKGSANWQIVSTVIGGIITIILVSRYTSGGFKKLDWVCIVAAVIGILLWIILQDAIFGIVISQLIGGIGSLPTIVAIWKDPKSESHSAWLLFLLSSTLTLISLPSFSLESVAQPATFFLVQAVIVCIICFDNKKQKILSHRRRVIQ